MGRQVCYRGLETFRCGIVGLLRLSAAEEYHLLYNPWSSRVEEMGDTMDMSEMAVILKKNKLIYQEIF